MQADQEHESRKNSREKENEKKARVNQFKLIFPSAENAEKEYLKFIDYSMFLYEQFTGSYSSKRNYLENSVFLNHDL